MEDFAKVRLFTMAAFLAIAAGLAFVAMAFVTMDVDQVKQALLLVIVSAVFACLAIIHSTLQFDAQAKPSVSQEERRLNAVRKIKTIARGMFEAKKGNWSTDNYHAYVRIRLNTELDDEIDDPDTTPFAHVMFSMLNGEWRIIFVETPEDMDLDYLESFDKIDNPFD